MKIIRRDFPAILPENEIAYFSLVEGLINSIDMNCVMEVRHSPDSYSFRISPSVPIYINSIVQEINSMHNMLNIKVGYGKSLKNSGAIFFKISLT